MLKVLLQTFLGLVGTVGGFAVFFFYIKGIDDGSNPFLLLLAVPLVVAGIFFLIRAGKSNATTFSLEEENAKNEKTAKVKKGDKNLLEKSNEYTAEWKKTSDTRDRLKLLQISANADDSK